MFVTPWPVPERGVGTWLNGIPPSTKVPTCKNAKVVNKTDKIHVKLAILLKTVTHKKACGLLWSSAFSKSRKKAIIREHRNVYLCSWRMRTLGLGGDIDSSEIETINGQNNTPNVAISAATADDQEPRIIHNVIFSCETQLQQWCWK